jgi:hypothetical protein
MNRPEAAPAVRRPGHSSVRAPRGEESRAESVLVVGVAAAAGVLLAKIVDWRGHAHPR